MGSRGGAADVLVVGAGVAGLSCARDLAGLGASVVVLEKARGVGGRVATRRVDGQPVDFGVVFFHGSDPAFLGDVENAGGADVLSGWPERRSGAGFPCQPSAFDPTQRRLAFATGASSFPKRLAESLDIRLRTRAVGIEDRVSTVAVRTEAGDAVEARDVVLALPIEQSLDLLRTLTDPPVGVESARALLESISSLPCLTVLAGWSDVDLAPPWDIAYPEDSTALQLVSNESAKRRSARDLILVLQARPSWSRGRIGGDPAEWSAALLEDAARLLGSWARRPAWSMPHRWRYARLSRGDEFCIPILTRLRGSARLGLAGEAFSPGGGVEAAWRSGREMARLISGRGDR